MDRLTRKITEAMNLMKLMKWDATMREGDPVLVCWTNSYNAYRVKGKVARINRESVVSELTESVTSSGVLQYPVGKLITTPRPTMNGITGRWSWNNCTLPQDTSIISESELKELRRG